MRTLVFLALLGCGGAPEGSSSEVRDALEAWRAGVSAMEKGDLDQARASFLEARRLQPEEPVLLAWQARAEAELGNLQDAIELLDRALLLRPNFAEARYNRGAYLARMGRLEAAGEELSLAMASGEWSARQVAGDPDFEPHLGHPALSFLPESAVGASWVRVPEGPIFQGSSFTLTAYLYGGQDRSVGVTAEHLEGPMRLTGGQETLLDSTEGPVRELSWTWTVTGPGVAEVGPLAVTAGSRIARLDAVKLDLIGPVDDLEGMPVHRSRLPTPLEFGAGERPRASLLDGDLVVVLDHGDRLEVLPPPENRAQTFVYSERDAPVYRVYRWTTAGEQPRRVRVERGGREILNTRVGEQP